MNVIDLHPEELIDRLTSGTLSADERARLDAHLSSCDECRFEISVRGDLEEESRNHRERPLVAVLGPTEKTVPSSRPGSVRPRTAKKRALLLPILAAALLAGGAFAAVVSEVVRARDERLERLERTSRPDGREEPASGAVKTHEPLSIGARGATGPSLSVTDTAPEAPLGESADKRRLVAGAVTAPVAAEAAAVTLPAPASTRGSRLMPSSSVVRAVTARATTATNVRPTTAASDATPIAAPPSARLPDARPEATPSRGDASTVFGTANRARRDGETARAVQLYRELQGRFPASEEARLSRATLATLLLDRGDARAALDGFDRYLAQGGASLGVEALVGRALSLQQLGQRDAELAAWRDVLRRFPGTVHAHRAAARIATLGER
jgi:TolA-binding protein